MVLDFRKPHWYMIVFIVDLSTVSVNFILSFNHVNEQKLYFVWHSENAKWEGDERSEARMDLGFCKTFGSETLPHISTADRQEHPYYWWFNPDFLKMELNGRWRKKYVLIFVHTVLIIRTIGKDNDNIFSVNKITKERNDGNFILQKLFEFHFSRWFKVVITGN